MARLKYYLKNDVNDHVVPLHDGMLLDPAHWDVAHADEAHSVGFRVKVCLDDEGLLLEGLDEALFAFVNGKELRKGERLRVDPGQPVQFGEQTYLLEAKELSDTELARSYRPPGIFSKILQVATSTVTLVAFIAALTVYILVPPVQTWLGRMAPVHNCVKQVDTANYVSCYRLAHDMDRIDGKLLTPDNKEKILRNIEKWESANDQTWEQTYAKLPDAKRHLIESSYRKAIDAYQKQEFQAAQKLGETVLANISEYRDTRRLLMHIQRGIAAQQLPTEQPRMPASGRSKVLNMSAGDPEPAGPGRSTSLDMTDHN